MKKFLSVFLCVLLLLGLCACGGNISNIKTRDVDSEMYSKGEINAAINVIKREFAMNWSGCSLTEIYYAGDEITKEEYQYWADITNADEVIVLLSTFDVDASGGDGSLNPNSTYSNWNWILVRTNNGPWKHVDHGY